MAIQIRGRGFPLLVDVVSDNVVKFNLNSGTDIAITNAAVISASVFSGTTYAATTVTGTTIAGTTVSASTTLSGATVYCGTLSSHNATPSACGTPLTYHGTTSACMANNGGVVSADRFIKFTIAGATVYVPGYLSAGVGSAMA